MPWEQIVTAASTLIAGLGGVLLTSRANSRRETVQIREARRDAAHEARKAAYIELSEKAVQVLRTYREVVPNSTRRRAGPTSQEHEEVTALRRAFHKVEITGSEDVATAAQQMMDAFDVLATVLEQLHSEFDPSDAVDQVTEVDAAIAEYHKACREDVQQQIE